MKGTCLSAIQLVFTENIKSPMFVASLSNQEEHSLNISRYIASIEMRVNRSNFGCYLNKFRLLDARDSPILDSKFSFYDGQI